MAKKDNFGRAMFDMFGVGKEDAFEDEVVKGEVPATKKKEVPVYKEQKAVRPDEKKEYDAVKPAPAPVPAKVTFDKTIISNGVVIEGTLQCKGDLEIAGEIRGNIFCEGKVTALNKVEGNIVAGDVTVLGCAVTGDISAKGSIGIDDKSSVNGNLVALNVSCAGKIEGDIDVKDNISLDERAVINGNIIMGSMSVSRGAKITGQIQMQQN